MSTWRARISAASLVGACVFAVATGAGAVFVGNWWGRHHAPVVVQYVGPPGSSSARPSHAGEAMPGGAPARSQPTTVAGQVAGQPDADRAGSTPAASGTSRHRGATAPKPAATRIGPASSATAVKSAAPSSEPTSGDATPPATEPPASPTDPGSGDGSNDGSHGGNGQ